MFFSSSVIRSCYGYGIRWRYGFVFVALALSLVACSATKQARDVGFSGFLGDYSKLVKGSEGQELYVYNNPKANWAAYNKILLDPVMIWQDPQSAARLPEEDLQRLADFFYAALKEELQRDYTLVDKPGPSTLRIQTAIINVEKTNPALATVSSIASPLNPAFIGSLATNMITGKPLGSGETTIEGKVTNAQTGELLGAAVDRRFGVATMGTSKFDSWGEVEQALLFWAKNSRYRLCRARGAADCQPPK